MKVKSVFRCQKCGYSSAKWLGKCPECGEWNTFVEEQEKAKTEPARRQLTPFSSEVVELSRVTHRESIRQITGISEFDRILGGGIVDGSLILLGGPPGIGKSTLMLQTSYALALREKKILYISGEESLEQTALRAKRLKLNSNGIYLVAENNLENILEAVNKTAPDYVIVDSIQTVFHPELSGAPGTVGQVRECAAEFLRLAKSGKRTVFLLGHVTKEGDIAGPRVLEHIVDTVLYFESEKQQIFRILRAYKNRFGPTSEIGIFEMTTEGLIEVKNPSAIFLAERTTNIAGSAVTVTMEGTRPFLVEVQALVAPTNFGVPRRQVNGFDYNRAVLLIAVLERRVGLPLGSVDIFINIAGGMKIKETAIDLATAVAVASAQSNFVVPEEAIFIGEVGLAGEVRSVVQLSERLSEAEKLGFKTAIIPGKNLIRKYSGKLKIIPVETVSQAISVVKK